MNSLGEARALARELDAFLAGDTSRTRVGLIEGALSSADGIAGKMGTFDDLEYAAALFSPGGGPEDFDVAAFEHVARMVRAELREIFGV